MINDICNKIKEYEDINPPTTREFKIFTGRQGYEMIMKAMNPEYTSSTTCTTTIPIKRTKRPYKHPTLLSQGLIESLGWTWTEDNGIRWWYTKTDKFNEAPMSAGYQHTSYTLCHDPEMESIKITVLYRGNIEEEVIYEGVCQDYETLILIENLTNVSGEHNPRYN